MRVRLDFCVFVGCDSKQLLFLSDANKGSTLFVCGDVM